MQYQETDLDFVRRLLAEEGLVFNFEHQEAVERFTIYDGAAVDAGALSAIEGEALNEALRLVLEHMEPMAYGDATTGLTAEEQTVLREGGLTLEPTPGPP